MPEIGGRLHSAHTTCLSLPEPLNGPGLRDIVFKDFQENATTVGIIEILEVDACFER